MITKTFKQFHKLAVDISQYLPLSYGLPLDQYQSKSSRNRIEQGEMYGIVGKTGSGKTTWEKTFILSKWAKKPTLNRYFLDSKKQGDFTSKDGPIIKSAMSPQPLTGEGEIQIWQPSEDNIEVYDDYFNGILSAGKPAIVGIDETINLKFGNRIPRGYEILLKQGRLPGIHVISCTQELARAPRQLISQASHILIFRVINTYDESMARQYLRLRETKELPFQGKFSFFYIRPDIDSQAEFFSDYKEWFRKHG
jgi:energy-coupling factor transporter ATP-binding protein EcfA2